MKDLGIRKKKRDEQQQQQLDLAENLPKELFTKELFTKKLFKSVFRFCEKIIMKSFIKNIPKKN